MKKNALYIAAGVVLFLAWRNGSAHQAAKAQLVETVPTDPYNLGTAWDVLNASSPNAHPSQNDVCNCGLMGDAVISL